MNGTASVSDTPHAGSVEEFVETVVSLAKQVLLDSMQMSDCVALPDGELKFSEHGRQAATVVSKLLELVSTASMPNRAMHEELAKSARESRDALLELCRTTKEALGKGDDPQLTQRLQTSRRTLALAVKAVLSQAESLRTVPTESAPPAPAPEPVEKVLEEARLAVQTIARMVTAARNQNQDTFVESAKQAATAMSRLIEIARVRLPAQQEPLFNSTQVVIRSAKATFKDCTKANQEQLDAAMKTIADDITTFITSVSGMATATADGVSSPRGTVLRKDSSGARPAPLILPPPAPVGTASLSARAVPLPPPPSLPAPASATVGASPPASLPPLPLPQSASYGSLATVAPVGQTFAYVVETLKLFLADFPAFRVEWHAQNLTAQESFVHRLESVERNTALVPLSAKMAMLRSLFPAAAPGDGRTLMELEMFRHLSVGMSFKKRFANVSRELLVTRPDELFAIAKESVVNQLMSFAPQLGEVAIKFILCAFVTSGVALDDADVAAAASVVTATSAGDLESLTRELFDCLRCVAVVVRASIMLPQYAAVEKVLSSFLSQLDTAPVRGVLDEGVRAVATTRIALLVSVSLKHRIWRESNSLRVLTLHLLATVHAASAVRNALHYVAAFQLGLIAKSLLEAVGRVLNLHETCRFLETHRRDTLSAVDIEPALQEETISSASVSSPVPLSNSLSSLSAGSSSSSSYSSSSSKSGGSTGKSGGSTRSIKMAAAEAAAELKEPDRSIWDEGEISARDLQLAKEKGVSTGSLNKLLLYLSAEGAYDNKLLKTFITTYRSFASPHRLWAKLLDRFNVPASEPKEKAQKIKVRVSVIINCWVQNNFFDFDDSLIEQLFEFVDKTLPSEQLNDVAGPLRKLLRSQLEARSELDISAPPTDLALPEAKQSPAELFAAMNDEEIARQLTLLEFSIYRQIEPSELLNQSWNKDKLKYRAPHVIESLGRLNRISFWVPTIVLSQERLRDRVRVYCKFVRIAEHLRRMNNYHTLMGVVVGLNASAVTRLKHTMNAVGDELQKSFRELVQLMHPSGSYKKYRDAVRKSSAPLIPYIGTYLQDLTFIEDGNPDTINGEINFKKREQIYQVLQEVQLYQSKPYDFPLVEPISTFLNEMPFASEKELHEVSLLTEPKDADLKQIVQ